MESFRVPLSSLLPFVCWETIAGTGGRLGFSRAVLHHVGALNPSKPNETGAPEAVLQALYHTINYQMFSCNTSYLFWVVHKCRFTFWLPPCSRYVVARFPVCNARGRVFALADAFGQNIPYLTSASTPQETQIIHVLVRNSSISFSGVVWTCGQQVQRNPRFYWNELVPTQTQHPRSQNTMQFSSCTCVYLHYLKWENKEVTCLKIWKKKLTFVRIEASPLIELDIVVILYFSHITKACKLPFSPQSHHNSN